VTQISAQHFWVKIWHATARARVPRRRVPGTRRRAHAARAIQIAKILLSKNSNTTQNSDFSNINKLPDWLLIAATPLPLRLK
jgi:hypothetical protein